MPRGFAPARRRPSGSRATAVTRPSRPGGPERHVVSAALKVADRPRIEPRLERERPRHEALAGRTTRSGGRCGTRARRSPPAGSCRGRRGEGRRAAPTAPAGRRRAFPRRGTARRREARAPGESVVRGRLPGSSDDGRPSSSQNICARVPSGQPSAGMTGELCSQPPLGVAEMRFPKRSAISRCTVSPTAARRSPAVRSRRAQRGEAAECPGRSSAEASSPTSARRASLYSVREQRLERDVL